MAAQRMIKQRSKAFLFSALRGVSVFVFVRSIISLVLTRLINRGLKKSPFRGEVKDVELSLLKGAVALRGVDVAANKRMAAVPRPALHLDRAAIRIWWKELLK